MPISEKSYKVIWGQFAGRCCLCREEVIHETEQSGASLVGEVAHIVGERPDAARGNSPLSVEERNDPDNLLLLCRKHHKIIDDDPANYTVERLQQAKDEFLAWIDTQLSRATPWKSNLAQLAYINVPRLCEQAELAGIRVDLSRYRDDQTLHSLGWDLNHVMAAFQAVLGRLQVSALPVQSLEVHESHIGALVSFDRLRFRTKNISLDAMDAKKRWKQAFTGDLSKDPHVYAKFGSRKLVIFIDPNWITTTTAFTLFKPSAGQSTFSGLARITNVDYENQTATATALVIGLPRSPLDEAFENAGRRTASTSASGTDGHAALDALVDMERAKQHNVYFSSPPDACDLCGRSLGQEKYMIDCGIKGVPQGWACMCADCFSTHGRGIGWGTGQLYLRDSKGWLEVAGFRPASAEGNF